MVKWYLSILPNPGRLLAFYALAVRIHRGLIAGRGKLWDDSIRPARSVRYDSRCNFFLSQASSVSRWPMILYNSSIKSSFSLSSRFRLSVKRADNPSLANRSHWRTWVGWTWYTELIWLTVLSPFKAARATEAF